MKCMICSVLLSHHVPFGFRLFTGGKHVNVLNIHQIQSPREDENVWTERYTHGTVIATT